MEEVKELLKALLEKVSEIHAIIKHYYDEDLEARGGSTETAPSDSDKTESVDPYPDNWWVGKSDSDLDKERKHMHSLLVQYRDSFEGDGKTQVVLLIKGLGYNRFSEIPFSRYGELIKKIYG